MRRWATRNRRAGATGAPAGGADGRHPGHAAADRARWVYEPKLDGFITVTELLTELHDRVPTVLRQGTTVVPHHAVSRLVTAGPFQFTRNPMYTGHVVVLLGAALRTGSGWPLLIVPLCMQATTPLVILPEEEYLTRRFGEDYERYRARVRRWI